MGKTLALLKSIANLSKLKVLDLDLSWDICYSKVFLLFSSVAQGKYQE
jgi:hypothetical protein